MGEAEKKMREGEGRNTAKHNLKGAIQGNGRGQKGGAKPKNLTAKDLGHQNQRSYPGKEKNNSSPNFTIWNKEDQRGVRKCRRKRSFGCRENLALRKLSEREQGKR